MKLRVFILALVAISSAEDKNSQRRARAPMAHIKYDDPNGSKVNWQYFSPDSQYRTQVESSQGRTSARLQRAESNTAIAHRPTQVQAQPALVAQAAPNQQDYKSFSAIPASIRQLISQAYPEPHKPYVNPSAFIYNTQFAASPQYDQQSATAESSAARYEQPFAYGFIGQQTSPVKRDHVNRRQRLQGKIEYTEDYPRQEAQRPASHVTVPIGIMPVQPLPELILDKNMPMEIQQLLQYQAYIPYDVTANKISYRPKKLFIPKPLPEEDADRRGPYYYRSKTYYMKGDEIQPDYETSTPTLLNRQH